MPEAVVIARNNATAPGIVPLAPAPWAYTLAMPSR
jgi:hypothetical protein